MPVDIPGLRQKRAEKQDRMEQIVAQAANEDRDMSEVEKLAFDELDAEVDALSDQIERAEKVQKLKAATALPVTADALRPAPAPAPAEARAPEEKGIVLARIVRSLIAERGSARAAQQFAVEQWGPEGEVVAKALAAGSSAAGGFLVPDQYSAEIIELLYERTVVRRAGPRTIPLAGSTLIPKLTAGVAAGYVGENQDIPKSEPTFGQIRLTERKLAVLVPISNDLIRTSSPRADALVRDDIVAGMSVTEDQHFLRGIGTGNGPKGLRYWAAAENLIASTGTTSDKIETDLAAMVNALEGNNVAMVRPVWIMSARSKNALYVRRDAGGALTFADVREGRLWGYPIFTTNSIPTNLGIGANETEIYLVDMADVILGDANAIQIDASDAAAYYDGATLVSAYSQDQTVIRAIARHDLAVRHDQSVAVLTGAAW